MAGKTLKEILAEQKAAKEKANVTETPKPVGSIQEEAKPQLRENPKSEAEIGGNKAGGIVSGNGSISRQTNSPVASKGLSLRERLAQKNANMATNELQGKIETPVQQKAPEIAGTETGRVSSSEINTSVSPQQVTAIRATGDTGPIPGITDRHEQKTNDGNVDLEALRNNLAFLAMNIDQVQLVGDVVRKIAMQLRQNPALTPYMKDEDVDLVVRGVRRAYNVKVRTATEKKESKQNKTKLDLELGEAFKAAGLNFNLKG